MITDTKISWDELTERGRIASEKLDSGRWEIGDLACIVEREHGGKIFIADFAREIGQQIRTVQGYHRTARVFPERVRADAFVKWPNLFYSHYRTAARLESPKEAFAFLENASSNGWTTDEAEREMSLLLGKPERTANGQDSDSAAASVILNAEPCTLQRVVKLQLSEVYEAVFNLSPEQAARLSDVPYRTRLQITITELPTN